MAVHSVIGRLLSDGVRRPKPEQLLSYAASERLLAEGGVYRLAARARVTALTAIYFRYFAPDESWRFVAAAVRIADGDLDLVFERVRDGAVRIDELKTGPRQWTECARLEQQIDREIRGGQELYGEAFLGIRILFLAAPAQSFSVDAAGSREQPSRRGSDGKA